MIGGRKNELADSSQSCKLHVTNQGICHGAGIEAKVVPSEGFPGEAFPGEGAGAS